MKIAFFGNTKYSVIDAKALNNKFGLALIVTKPDKPAGRKRIANSNPVKIFATENKIPTIEIDKFPATLPEWNKVKSSHTPGVGPEARTNLDLIGHIRKYNLDFIVVADYGVILPKEVLAIPKFAPLNVHHSLLPKYRGPSPAPAAILAGNKISGVTIIKMAEEVDAGDILAQREYNLKPNETTDSLLTKLNELGGKLVCEVIENFQNVKPKPQDESKATSTHRMTKNDGRIDLDRPPDPITFDRMIRAYYPWPTVWTEIDGKLVKFIPDTRYQIPDTILIQPQGKRPMTVKEFLNGYPHLKPQIDKLLG